MDDHAWVQYIVRYKATYAQPQVGQKLCTNRYFDCLDGIVQDIHKNHMSLLVYNLLTVIISNTDLLKEGYQIQTKPSEGGDAADDDEFALENLGSKLVMRME